MGQRETKLTKQDERNEKGEGKQWETKEDKG
jgi:hypothetical protein